MRHLGTGTRHFKTEREILHDTACGLLVPLRDITTNIFYGGNCPECQAWKRKQLNQQELQALERQMKLGRERIQHLKKELGIDMEDSKYRNPKPTVDLVILIEPDQGNWQNPNVVLIKRKNPPHGWALPGGFVNEGESFEAAALREGLEETGLKLKLMEQFHTYSAPDRDPRQHNSSTVYLAELDGEKQTPLAADDATEIVVVSYDKALKMDLAFDHKTILEDVMYYAETGIRPTPWRRRS